MPGKSKPSSFTSHWIRFRIEGYQLEKVLSAAISKGAVFRGIVYENENSAVMSATLDGYRIVKSAARNRYRITVLSEGGYMPRAKLFLRQKLLIAGIMVFILCFFAQSQFIREVNIIGCKAVDETSVRECAEKAGLKKGGYKCFDAAKVQKAIYENFDQIVWVKVGTIGNYAEIQIAESKSGDSLPDKKEKTPCNIIADCDCYIERVCTFCGISMVEKDDYVKKGGILISGSVPIEKTTFVEKEEDRTKTLKVHAAGEITARVPYYFSINMKKGVHKEKADAMLREWIKNNVPENAQILNKSLNFSKKNNIMNMYGYVETRQKVGIEKEIAVDKRKSDNEDTGN